MSTTVVLAPQQVADAQSLGEATFARWSGRRGHYRNLLGSHVRGKYGEVGVEEWARRNELSPFEAIFRDLEREREADVRIRFTLVDVKTWDAKGWEAWGRCVAPTQLPALRRKASLIVWCYVATGPSVAVTIDGWNTLDEIAETAVRPTGPAGREVMNHQLAMSDVRPLASLFDHVGALSAD